MTKIHKLTNIISYEENNMKIGSCKDLKIINNHALKMRNTILLLNSMVLSGQKHTDKTKKLF